MLLAAVSDRSRGLRTEDVDVEGAVPDLTDLGSGCPFAPRYKHVMDVCHQAMPEPTQFEDERWVRCYLYEEARVGDGAPVCNSCIFTFSDANLCARCASVVKIV